MRNTQNQRLINRERKTDRKASDIDRKVEGKQGGNERTTNGQILRTSSITSAVLFGLGGRHGRQL